MAVPSAPTAPPCSSLTPSLRRPPTYPPSSSPPPTLLEELSPPTQPAPSRLPHQSSNRSSLLFTLDFLSLASPRSTLLRFFSLIFFLSFFCLIFLASFLPHFFVSFFTPLNIAEVFCLISCPSLCPMRMSLCCDSQ